MSKTFELPAYARGLRNNNPGNIELNPNTNWQGAAPTQQDGRFVQFDTPEAGARAMAKVLGAYRQRGTNTVADIINTWAPASENDTGAYIANVVRQTGLDPNTPLTEDQYPQLMAAITQHENGNMGQFTPEVLKAGWDAAHNGQALPHTPTGGKAIPQTNVTMTRPTDLTNLLNGTNPTTLSGQKQQQVAATTQAKQDSMDPYKNLDTDKTTLQDFLAQQSNGDPRYDQELIFGYEKARNAKAATIAAEDAKHWAKNAENGTLWGDVKNMAAAATTTTARIMGDVVNLPKTEALFQEASLTTDAAKQAYPVVKQYEDKVAELATLRQQVTDSTASTAEKNLRLAQLDQYQAKLSKPTAEQYAALEAPVAERAIYGDGFLGQVKPGFQNSPYDLSGKGRTNREALDHAAAANKEAQAVRSAIDSTYKGIYNDSFNRADFIDSVHGINNAHADALSKNWEQFSKAPGFGDAALGGLKTAAEGANWLLDQAGNAIQHPAAARDYAVEMAPYLVAGRISPALMGGLNAAYGKGVVQTAIQDYQKQHNGQLPSNSELATMMNAGTAAAAMEYVGEAGILKNIKQLAGKTAAKVATTAAAKETAQVARSGLQKTLIDAPMAATKAVATRATPVVESYLKEGATEGTQTYLEEDVSHLKGDTPSWGKIADAIAIGGVSGGGSVVGVGTPGAAIDSLVTVGQGVGKAAALGMQILQKRNAKTDAQQASDAATATDANLSDYQATVSAVPDTEIFNTLTPEEQQSHRDNLAQTTSVLETEFNSTLDQIEAEQRKPTAEEASRLKELHAALTELTTTQERISKPVETATAADVTTATTTVEPNTDTEPVVSAAQRVLFSMLTQPEQADVSTADALANNTSLSDTQRAIASSVPVFKELMSSMKSADEVHNDIMQGTERFKGIPQYIADMQRAITNNDANSALSTLKNLEQFRNRQQAKLAAGYNGGEHKPAIKQAITTEIAALNLAHVQLSELALAHLPALRQMAGTAANTNPLANVQAALDQAKAALAQPVAKPVTPNVVNTSPKIDTSTASVDTVNTSVPVTEQTAPITIPEGTPNLQQLATENQAARKSAQDTQTETSTGTVAPLTQVQGAPVLASLKPDSKVAQSFHHRPSGNLLHRSANVLSQLADTAHVLHQQAKAMLDKSGYAALGHFTQYAQDVAQKLPQMVNLTDKFHDQNNHNNLFEDFATQTADGKVLLDENLMTQMAVSAFEWVATMGSMSIRNRDEDINKLLGRDGKAPVSPNERAAYATAGKLANNIVEELGAAIVQELPIKIMDTASPTTLAQLRTAMGTMAVSLLLEQGLLESRWVRSTHTKDAQGKISVNRELFVGDDAPAKTSDNTVIEKYLRVTTAVQEENGLKREVGSAAVQDAKNAYKALKPFLTDLLGAQGKHDTVYTDANDIPAYKNDMNGNPLSTRQAEALTKHSQRPHRFKQGMLTLLKAMSPLQQALMLGYTVNAEQTVMAARLDSVNSVNDQVLEELDNLFTTHDELGDKPFFFQHSVAVNKRMHMVSRTVNPQGSQLHRHAITMDDQVSTVDWSNAQQQRQFKIAVAEAFGFEVDKNTATSAEQRFEELLQDPVIQAGITAAKAILDGSTDQDLMSDLQAAIEHGKEGIYTLDGLLALTKMDTTQPFESDLFRKVDGITNGTAIGLLQLAGTATYQAIRGMLARTGIFLDSNQTSYGEWYNEAGHNDSYQELTSNILDYIHSMDFHGKWADSPAENAQLIDQRGGIDFFFGARNFIKNGKVSKTGRKLTKAPLMTSNYGAAMPSIIAGLTDSLVTNIYKAIEDANDAQDGDALREIESQVQSILGADARLFTIDRKNPLATVISPRAQQALNVAMTQTYGRAMEASMGKEYAVQKQHAKLVNDATHLAFEAFKVMYERKTQELLTEKQKQDPEAQLSNADIRAVLKELAPVSPIIATALSNQVSNDKAIADGVNFVRRVKVRQVGVTEAEQKANSVKVQTNRLSGDKAGKRRVLTMYTYGEDFKDPGVSPAVLLIQSFDAATMVELLNQHGVLNVHDAGIMASNTTEEVTQDFNKAFLNLHKQYSMLQATQNMLTRTLTAYREMTGDTLLKSLNFRDFKQVNALTQETMTAHAFEALFNEAVPRIEANRQQVLGHVQSVVQYNAENGAYTPSEDSTLTDAQMQEVLANLYQDTVPEAEFQPLPVSLSYMSDRQLKQPELPQAETLDPEEQFAVSQQESANDFFTAQALHTEEFPVDNLLAQALQEGATAAQLISLLKQHPDMGKVRLAILERMAKSLPADLDIRLIDTPTAALEEGGNAAQLPNQRSTGFYTSKDEKTGRPTVYIAGTGFRFSGTNIQTVMHELFHAATLAKLHAEAAKPATEQSADFKNLQKLYRYSKRTLPHMAHRMADIFEFVTEAHSNVAFAQALAKLQVNNNAKVSVYDKFVESIGKLLGLFKGKDTNTNVLFEVIAATNSLYAQRYDNSQETVVTSAQRAARFANTVRTVTTNNAQGIFEELGKLNRSPISANQQNRLQSVLNTLMPVLTQVKLHLRKANQGNAVRTDQLKQRMVVDVGQQAGAHGIDMSAQEAYVHGLLKVVLDSKLESQHPAAQELARLFDQAEKVLTVVDFLADPSQQTDPIAMAEAQRRYDYLFRSGNSVTKQRKAAYIGVSVNDVYSDHLHTFVAMALTHAPLQAALSKLDSRITKNLKKEGRSPAQWLLDTVQLLISAMALRLRRSNDHRMDGRILELVERLAAVDQRHASRIVAAMNSGKEFISDNVEKVLLTATRSLTTLLSSAPVTASKNKAIRVTGKAANMLLQGNGPALAQAIDKTLERTKVLKRGLLASTIQEIAGNTEKRRELYRALQKRVKVIDNMRQDTLTKYGKYLTKSFQQPLTPEFVNAMTRVVLRTDFDTVVQQFGTARALELLRNPAQLKQEIAQLTQQIQAQPNGVFYAAMADNLGYFMVTVQSKKAHLLRNAHAIAQLAGTGRLPPKGDLTTVTAQIDLLASLSAQLYVDKQEQRTLLNFLDKELDATNLADPNSGLAITLHAHRQLKEKSLKELFHGNPMQMQKGYVRETFDPRVQIIVADAVEGAQLEKLGYVKGTQVQHDAAAAGVFKKEVYYYSIENNGDTHYRTGAFSGTGQNARGTDLFQVQQQAGVIDPALASYLERKLIQKNKQADIDAIFLNGGKDVTEPQAAPVLDDNGNISNYAYLMSDSQRRHWKKRNDDFRHVLGTSLASVSDKAESISLNREIMDTLFADHQANKDKEKHRFVVLSSNSPDKEFRDAYQKLSSDARGYAAQLWGGKHLYVREDQFQLLFGYRPLAISQLRLDDRTDQHGIQRMLQVTHNLTVKLLNNRLGRSADLAWQELVHMAKDTIVIKSMSVTMNNVVSNLLLLRAHGVPVKDALRDSVIAFRGAIEYQRSQQQLFEVEQELDRGAVGDRRNVLLQSQRKLKQQLRTNPVRELMTEGVLQSVVEDVDTVDDIYSYEGIIESKLNKLGKYTPELVKSGAKLLTLHHSTALYKVFRDTAMLSDFAARYALHQYNTKTKKNPLSVADSLVDVMEAFVNYEAPTHKFIQFLNDHDPVMFTKYLLRTQKVIYKLLHKRPAELLMLAVMQQLFGNLPDVTDSMMSVSSLGRFIPSPTSLLDGLTDSVTLNVLAQ